jgi:hypothetical protein
VTSTLHRIEPAAAIEEVTAAGFRARGAVGPARQSGRSQDRRRARSLDPGRDEKFAMRFRKSRVAARPRQALHFPTVGEIRQYPAWRFFAKFLARFENPRISAIFSILARPCNAWCIGG